MIYLLPSTDNIHTVIAKRLARTSTTHRLTLGPGLTGIGSMKVRSPDPSSGIEPRIGEHLTTVTRPQASPRLVSFCWTVLLCISPAASREKAGSVVCTVSILITDALRHRTDGV